MIANRLTYSFILLTYNQEDTVLAAVKAALEQDCAPMEIVISDDCSTDGTFRIIEGAAADYTGPHRVLVNRNEVNLGLAGHIRRVHEISKGDVLIAAAGDDISLPRRSARIMETFEATQPLLVCSLARVVGPDGKDVPANYRSATFYNTFDPIVAAKSRALYLGATGAWRRELFEKYGPMEQGAYEDLVMGFRAAIEGKVAVINDELVIYRLGSGITNSSLASHDKAQLISYQIRQLTVWQAVLRQRFKDAQTFGLGRRSAVWLALLVANKRARLQIAYYRNDWPEMLTYGLRHPLYLLHTLHFERRRVRKLMHRAREAAK